MRMMFSWIIRTEMSLACLLKVSMVSKITPNILTVLTARTVLPLIVMSSVVSFFLLNGMNNINWLLAGEMIRLRF